MKKQCSQCGETKPVSEYYLSAYKVPNAYCKKCAKRKYDKTRIKTDQWSNLFIGSDNWHQVYFG